jgi:hypothetical protein
VKNLRALWKKLCGRVAWYFLKAADFDNIANELLQACHVYADPALQIPIRFDAISRRIARVDEDHRSVAESLSQELEVHRLYLEALQAVLRKSGFRELPELAPKTE